MSFTYSRAGGNAASYGATGAITTATSAAAAHASTWAAGYRDNRDNSTNILANLVTQNALSDLFAVTVPRQTVGSSTIDQSCQRTPTAACTAVALELNSDAQGNFTDACTLTSGTLTITALSATNAQGTFQGAGRCVQTVSPFTVSTWTVSNGSFNVPLLVSPPNIP